MNFSQRTIANLKKRKVDHGIPSSLNTEYDKRDHHNANISAKDINVDANEIARFP